MIFTCQRVTSLMICHRTVSVYVIAHYMTYSMSGLQWLGKDSVPLVAESMLFWMLYMTCRRYMFLMNSVVKACSVHPLKKKT